jgi:hypothetical protein
MVVGGVHRWCQNLGQKKCKEVYISHARGIAQWRGQTTARRWRAAGGLHLDVGEKSDEKGSFGRRLHFYRRGREGGMVPVLHIDEGRPTTHRSSGDAACIGFPCPGSLTGGPEAVWSALFIARPTKNWFSFFSNWTEFVNCENYSSGAPKFTIW